MRNILKLLFGFLEAMIDIAEDKPMKCYVSSYNAREKLEKGMISIREYNESFENNNRF